MSAPKSILKNGGPSSKPGPSRAGPSRLTGRKGVEKSVPGVKKGGMKVAMKRRRDEDEDEDDDDDGEDEDDAMDEDDEGMDEDEDEGDDQGDQGDEESDDTDDEIARSKEKSKRPQKKKRTTTASDFGSTLTSLLTEPTRVKASKSKLTTTPGTTTTTTAAAEPTTESTKPTRPTRPTPGTHASVSATAKSAILSLSARPAPPTISAETLERRAARALKAEKAERLDKARVKDVVEGWAPASGDLGSQEFEKGLRKVAQRGVIKLFNAILSASRQSETARSALPLSAGVNTELGPSSANTGGKRKEKDNVMGRGNGKDGELTKESFLDLVRRGGK